MSLITSKSFRHESDDMIHAYRNVGTTCMIDSKMAKLYLKWFQRIPTEFNKDKDFDTYISKWSVYTRYSYGFSDWSWIYGHAVA